MMPETNCNEGDVVVECYNDLRCYGYHVSCSVGSCAFDEPVTSQRAVFDAFYVFVTTKCRLCHAFKS